MRMIRFESRRALLRLAALVFLAVFLVGCVSTEALQVKTYQAELRPMVGRNEPEVIALITQDWKFGLLNRWAAENPDVETVLKNKFRSFGFSKSEAEEIFTPPGKYQVIVFTKPLSREEVQTGGVDSSGNGMLLTNERLQSVTHGYIRIVLRDAKLIHFWVGL